jgi:hypothetical protein
MLAFNGYGVLYFWGSGAAVPSATPQERPCLEQHGGDAEDAQLERDCRPHHHIRVRRMATMSKPL